MLFLKASLCVLEGQNAIYDALISHLRIPQNTFYIIKDLALMVYFLI